MSPIKKKKENQIYNIDGYRNLANAVVTKAAKDYRGALKRLLRRPDDIGANKTKNDCERFFHDEVSYYTDLDGPTIMRMIQERVDKECEKCG